MTRAHILSTDGPYLEAIICIEEQLLCIMDEFSTAGDPSPEVGQQLNLELITLLDDDEPWESMFRGNPERKTGLEPLGGWRYRAYGQVTQVQPVVVDCGVILVEDPVHSNDSGLIGEYIAFTITRLGGRSGAR